MYVCTYVRMYVCMYVCNLFFALNYTELDDKIMELQKQKTAARKSQDE